MKGGARRRFTSNMQSGTSTAATCLGLDKNEMEKACVDSLVHSPAKARQRLKARFQQAWDKVDKDKAIIMATEDASESEGASTSLPSDMSASTNNGKGAIWAHFMTKNYHHRDGGKTTSSSVWSRSSIEDDDEEDEHEGGCQRMCMDGLYSFKRECSHLTGTVMKHPKLLLWALVAFAMFATCGHLAIDSIKSSQESETKNDATFTAMDTAQWFRDEFQKMLLPLYSLQQAVIHSPYFKDLTAKIGERLKDGSAPVIPGPNGEYDYRNVTGICDNAELQGIFDDMVKDIQTDNQVDGYVVQYKLAPHSVFCYASPLVNDRDFGPGQVLDATDSMGKDVLYTDSAMWEQATRVILTNDNTDMDIFGPVPTQIMEEMYCAHVNVKIPGIQPSLVVDGKPLETWGFIQNYIHWAKFKQESGIYERFSRKGLEFHLTRRDVMVNEITNQDQVTEVTIATSSHSNLLDDTNSVIVSVETANGVWYNRVGYPGGFEPSWYLPALVISYIGSFVLAMIYLIVLTQKKIQKKLLYKMMPKRAIRKLERGETVIERYRVVTFFFSDIIGFTDMSRERDPIQIMAMLNEVYVEFDKLVDKHKLYKVETIGDAYMVVGGAPHRCSPMEAAERVALFALDAMNFVRNYRTMDGSHIYIRAGMHSGPAMAGVIGAAMPRYCFFGDTVNTASRMESSSKSMRLQCSQMTQTLLLNAPTKDFDLLERQERGQRGVIIKGKGRMYTYWVKSAADRKGGDTSADAPPSLEDDLDDMTTGEQEGPRIDLELGNDVVRLQQPSVGNNNPSDASKASERFVL